MEQVFLEEMLKHMEVREIEIATYAVYLYFWSAFHMVPHNILAPKLDKDRFEKQTVSWIIPCLHVCTAASKELQSMG